MPSLSTIQFKQQLPSSLPTTMTTTTTGLSSQQSQHQSLLSQQPLPTQQQSTPLQQHSPASISRWLPDSSTFVIKAYLPIRKPANNNNHAHLELVTQNYCLLHKTYYAYSWCPSCQTHFNF